MRLHELRLAAVGPFADEQVVPLRDLGASGLFLLEGPTGSGKSTVVDAVVFALYGPPADASAQRWHSQYADADVKPFVQLVFETSAGIYAVRRAPAYERRKKRGEGTTAERAGVVLRRLASPDDPGGGDVLSTRVDEANREVVRAVGLTREQFVQTVVLQQGRFAEFLRASSTQRQEVLEQLFGTQLYSAVTAELAGRRRGAARATDQARELLAAAVHAFAGVAGDPAAADGGAGAADGEAPAPGTAAQDGTAQDGTAQDAAVGGPAADWADLAAGAPEELLARGAATLDALGARLGRRRGRLGELEAAERAAEDDLAGRLEAAERVGRLRDLLGRRERLAAAAHAAADDARRLDAAARAAAVLPVVAGLRTARDRAADLRGRAGAAQAALGPVLGPASGSVPDHGSAPASDQDPLRTAEARLRHEAGALDELVRQEDDLARRRREDEESGGRLDGLRRRAGELRGQVARRPGYLAGLRAERDGHAERAAQEKSCAANIQRATRALEAARRAATLARRAEGAEIRRDRRRQEARRAVGTEADLRRRRLDQMAGELGLGLADGHPCPVCGSRDHPDPAVLPPGHVTADEIAEAEQARGQAERIAQEAADEYATLRSDLAQALTAAEGRDEAAAARVLEGWAVEHAEIVAARARKEELDLELEESDRLGAVLEAELRDAERDTSTLEERLRARQEETAALAARVSAARAEHRSVAARRAALLALAGQVAAAAEAGAAADAAAAEVGRRDSDCRGRLAAERFADEAQALAAALDDAAAAALRARVERRGREEAAVADGLAAADLAGVDPAADADVDAARAARDAARGRAGALRAEVAALAERHDRAAELWGKVRGALAHRDRTVAAHAAVVRMADLAAGTRPANPSAMGLSAFVLSRRFGDVVAAANARLSLMSGDRYALEHTEDRTGNARAGLGLVVRDQTTEQTRAPETLSGGETFYCSLALALGLADVVTAEAGGVDLGTLFVDEGFGSLDPQTLDDVLAVLGRLRAGGRVVGVVSHVAELKERIPERIEVRRRPGGASTVTVRC